MDDLFIVRVFYSKPALLFYERPPEWLDTPNGATPFVRKPYSGLVHGTEGYSISKIDSRGYVNLDKPLSDNYVLMMGSSHTQGKEVPEDKRYSALVSEQIANDGLLHAYNIACDGNKLDTHIEYFDAAVKAFPGAEVITIEISDTDCSIDAINDALDQVIYDPKDSANRFLNLSLSTRLKNIVKVYMPLATKIKRDMEAAQEAENKDKNDMEDTSLNQEEYLITINKALGLIRSEYENPIVFVYHPEVIINSDASISLKYCDTWELFEKACENNNIDGIDSGKDFLVHYEKYSEVPYGFLNTRLGSGHLNRVGHKIISDEIVEYLGGLDK